MDSIFDEDVDEVGGEIEAYCPSSRCKADTTHTIISMYEDEVRRVQCVVCGDVHAYRKPRGEAYDEPIEPISRKKLLRKPSWAEAMGRVTEADLDKARPYSIRDHYEEMEIVAHPTFGVGFVTDLLPDNKVEVTFKDESRILVHNRADLSERMPSIAEIPAPREEKKRKRRKKKDAAPTPTPMSERMEPEELQRALEQAERARHQVVEEKRKLSKKFAVEQIRAKRATDEDGQPIEEARPTRGKGKAAKLAKAEAAKAEPSATAAKGKAKAAKPAKAEAAATLAKGKAAKPAKPAKPAKVEAAAAAAKPAKGKAAKPEAAAAKPAKGKATKPAKADAAAKGKAAAGAVVKKGAKKTVLLPAPGHRGPARLSTKPAKPTAKAAKGGAKKPAAKKPAAKAAAKKPAPKATAKKPAAKTAAKKPAAAKKAPSKKRSTPKRKG